MDGHMQRLTLILILLVLCGFLRFIINRLIESSDVSTHKSPKIVWPLDSNRAYCKHFGQEPTEEEAKEERHLLNSILWPGPLVQDLPLELSSDPTSSYFVILGSSKHRLGDHLLVNVHVHNFVGLPKNHGGDFLIARLHSPELGAGIAGKVRDYNDGTYTVLFPLLWVGVAWVEIIMVHPSEAVVVLKRLQEEQPDRVFFKSLFVTGNLSESTVCNLCLPLNLRPVCNYTDPFTGEPWYCYKPKMLSCDKRINHYKGGYKPNLITEYEAQFFQSDVNIKIPIPALGIDKVNILPAIQGQPKVKKNYNSAGYYLYDKWWPLNSKFIQRFDDSSSVTRCLRGKDIYMFGDSTVRQWFEYLSDVLDVTLLTPNSPKNSGPFIALDSTNNILVRYRCHGPPIRFSTVFSSELRHVANEIDKLQGGPDTIVLLSVWSHFSTFPVEIYIRRIRHIRRAVVRLLTRQPATLVVIRTANLQRIDPYYSLFNSDWFSLQRDIVLRAMFKGSGVLLLDAWEMTLAYHLPHELHPAQSIIKNMIDLILSQGRREADAHPSQLQARAECTLDSSQAIAGQEDADSYAAPLVESQQRFFFQPRTINGERYGQPLITQLAALGGTVTTHGEWGLNPQSVIQHLYHHPLRPQMDTGNFH